MMNREIARSARRSLVRCLFALLLLGEFLSGSYAESSTASVPSTGSSRAALTRLTPASAPLAFIENAGQVAGPAKFYLSGPRGSIFFTPTEVVFDVKERAPVREKKKRDDEAINAAAPKAPATIRGVVIRLSFPGANPKAELVGLEPLPGQLNDFRGKDPAKWRRNIHTCGRIAYRDLYPGVDLEFYGENGALKRRLVVHGNGDVKGAALRYSGAKESRVAADGALELVTDIGTIREEVMDMVTDTAAAELAYVSDSEGLVALVLSEEELTGKGNGHDLEKK